MIKNIFDGVMLSSKNPVKVHPERITRKDKELTNDLDYEKKKKILARLKQKTTFALMSFVMKIS